MIYSIFEKFYLKNQIFSRNKYKRFLKLHDTARNVEQISRNLMSDFEDFPTFGQIVRFLADIGGPVTFIILILELSNYMQNSWASHALLNGTIPRAPCTAVFLRSHVKNILYFFTFFFDDIWIGSHFYNIHPRIKCL